MRFPNQRLAQLFTLLQNETLPQEELAQRLSVSTRTVRADITALNALLQHYGAQFTLTRRGGSQPLFAGALFNLRVFYQAGGPGRCVVRQPRHLTGRHG